MNTFMMILFLLSMIAMFACIVKLIIAFIKKQDKKVKKKTSLLLILAIVIFFASAFGYTNTMSPEQIAEMQQQQLEEAIKKVNELEEKNKDNIKKEETSKEKPKKETVEKPKKETVKEETTKETSVSNEKPKEEKTEQPLPEYDLLQKLFISITDKTTVQEVENYITSNALYYTSAEYNTAKGGKKTNYKIAYAEGVAAQRHADSGDYLEIDFDENTTLMNAHYVNSNNIGYTALYYNYGTWYDFREEAPGEYTGYYIIDSLGDETGIVIKYSNGNEVETNYHKCSSAEDVIQKIFKKK